MNLQRDIEWIRKDLEKEERGKRIFIAGIAGTLGSGLAELLLSKGFEVKGNDIVRYEEAWKLGGIRDNLTYFWKSCTDLKSEDLRGSDIVIDASLGYADRPFGFSSPMTTTLQNILPGLGVLEAIRGLEERPILIVPSSFNSLYGHRETFTENLLPYPTSLYGFTKATQELLALSYYKSYGVPVIITRVASAFGKGGRSDELPHKLIIYGLTGRTISLHPPNAKRMWCYLGDVLQFYDKLIDRAEEFIGEVLHCSGNRGDVILENIELLRMVEEVIGRKISYVEEFPEPGEVIDGKPVDFTADSSYTRRVLNWEPQYTIREGLEKTTTWFKENLWRYTEIKEEAKGR